MNSTKLLWEVLSGALRVNFRLKEKYKNTDVTLCIPNYNKCSWMNPCTRLVISTCIFFLSVGTFFAPNILIPKAWQTMIPYSHKIAKPDPRSLKKKNADPSGVLIIYINRCLIGLDNLITSNDRWQNSNWFPSLADRKSVV